MATPEPIEQRKTVKINGLRKLLDGFVAGQGFEFQTGFEPACARLAVA